MSATEPTRCHTGVCTRIALPETASDATPHCYFHASRQQRQAHADALRAAARVRQRAPDLLAFVRIVVTCSNDPQLVARGAALLQRAEGETA